MYPCQPNTVHWTGSWFLHHIASQVKNNIFSRKLIHLYTSNRNRYFSYHGLANSCISFKKRQNCYFGFTDSDVGVFFTCISHRCKKIDIFVHTYTNDIAHMFKLVECYWLSIFMHFLLLNNFLMHPAAYLMNNS